MVQRFDYLVIGSGIAGMSFALKVANEGKSVALICKAGQEEANTYFAQGGIASVTNLKVDNFEKHIEDTMIAGDWISDRAAVEKVVREAPAQIEALIRWGVNFDKKESGEFDLHKEGGHSEFRILHHADNTGAEIQTSLIETVNNHPNIAVFTNHYAVEIITQHHIGPHIRRLNTLHKFAVAVVHHDLDVRLDLLAEADQLPDLLHGEAWAGGVALGALDGDELGALVDLGADGIVVEGAVGLQVRLGVGNTVLLQRALALPDADDLLQRVIGCAHGGEQFISRQQVGGQGYGQGVGAAGDLRPHQRSLRVEHICIDPFQIVPALVIVAVAGGGGKVGGIYPILLHGGQDLGLIVFRRLVDGVKPVPQLRNDPLSVFIDSCADAQLFVHGFHFHVLCSSFPKISSARSFRISGRVTTSPLASLPRISRVSPGEMP